MENSINTDKVVLQVPTLFLWLINNNPKEILEIVQKVAQNINIEKHLSACQKPTAPEEVVEVLRSNKSLYLPNIKIIDTDNVFCFTLRNFIYSQQEHPLLKGLITFKQDSPKTYSIAELNKPKQLNVEEIEILSIIHRVYDKVYNNFEKLPLQPLVNIVAIMQDIRRQLEKAKILILEDDKQLFIDFWQYIAELVYNDSII